MMPIRETDQTGTGWGGYRRVYPDLLRRKVLEKLNNTKLPELLVPIETATDTAKAKQEKSGSKAEEWCIHFAKKLV